MRTLRKNKTRLWYALNVGEVPVYQTDDEGNVVTITVRHVATPVRTGEMKQGYTTPIEFKGNIVKSGGQAQATAFGLSLEDYSAVLIVNKEQLPITESSLIWTETPVLTDGTYEGSAAYTVAKVIDSLNGARYALREKVKKNV